MCKTLLKAKMNPLKAYEKVCEQASSVETCSPCPDSKALSNKDIHALHCSIEMRDNTYSLLTDSNTLYDRDDTKAFVIYEDEDDNGDTATLARRKS
jgi:hypothetical protein